MRTAEEWFPDFGESQPLVGFIMLIRAIQSDAIETAARGVETAFVTEPDRQSKYAFDRMGDTDYIADKIRALKPKETP